MVAGSATQAAKGALMVYKIEQVFIQTDNGVREAYWIKPAENHNVKLFASKKAAIDYLNGSIDSDYEPEEPSYDN